MNLLAHHMSPHDGRAERGISLYLKSARCTSGTQPFAGDHTFLHSNTHHISHTHTCFFSLPTFFSTYLSTTTPFSSLLPCLYYILLASISDRRATTATQCFSHHFFSHGQFIGLYGLAKATLQNKFPRRAQLSS